MLDMADELRVMGLPRVVVVSDYGKLLLTRTTEMQLTRFLSLQHGLSLSDTNVVGWWMIYAASYVSTLVSLLRYNLSLVAFT